MTPLIVALLYGLCAFMIVWFFTGSIMEKRIMNERTRALRESPEHSERPRSKQPILGIPSLEKRRQWRKSGFKTPLPLEAIIVMGVVFVGAGYVILFYTHFLPVMKMLLLIINALVALRIARIMAERRRVALIKRELPAALDLIVVCLEAGLGLEAAFLRVSSELKGTPLGGELKQTFHEVSAGIPLEDALRNFAHRARVSEINAIIISIIQAQKMGTSLAGTFRVQADSLREKYRITMREKMAKVPIKILFPLVFFIFPALFVVILGPAAITIFKELVKPGS